MRQVRINYCFAIGIIIAIGLGLVAFMRTVNTNEGFANLFKKQNKDNNDVWKIDAHTDTNTLQFIYQGNLVGDGDKRTAMTLTKDGVLTVHNGYSFSRPIDRSWLITPDKHNALIIANKQGGGITLDSQGGILPMKYMGGGKGGPMDLAKLCMQDDGSSKIYGGLCGD